MYPTKMATKMAILCHCRVLCGALCLSPTVLVSFYKQIVRFLVLCSTVVYILFVYLEKQ